jgi:hypothetical protein
MRTFILIALLSATPASADVYTDCVIDYSGYLGAAMTAPVTANAVDRKCKEKKDDAAKVAKEKSPFGDLPVRQVAPWLKK